MMPHEVSGNSAADVVALADGLMQPGHPLMVLFSHDPIWFSHLFTVLVSDAQLRSGVRRVQLGRQPRTQPVFPIFTGEWDSFAEPLSKPDSFLRRLHYWYNPMHMPDEGTGVRFVKVI